MPCHVHGTMGTHNRLPAGGCVYTTRLRAWGMWRRRRASVRLLLHEGEPWPVLVAAPANMADMLLWRPLHVARAVTRCSALSLPAGGRRIGVMTAYLQEVCVAGDAPMPWSSAALLACAFRYSLLFMWLVFHTRAAS